MAKDISMAWLATIGLSVATALGIVAGWFLVDYMIEAGNNRRPIWELIEQDVTGKPPRWA